MWLPVLRMHVHTSFTHHHGSSSSNAARRKRRAIITMYLIQHFSQKRVSDKNKWRKSVYHTRPSFPPKRRSSRGKLHPPHPSLRSSLRTHPPLCIPQRKASAHADAVHRGEMSSFTGRAQRARTKRLITKDAPVPVCQSVAAVHVQARGNEELCAGKKCAQTTSSKAASKWK